MTRPTVGQPAWGPVLNQDITGVEAKADDALAAAATTAAQVSSIEAALPGQVAAEVAAQVRTYQPEAYGAVGDGSTNDSSAWQAMFDAIEVEGVGRVLCRKDAVYLMGDVEVNGIADVVVEGQGATIKAQSTPVRGCILVGHTRKVGRVTFEGFTFDDDASNRPAEDKQLLVYRQWERLTIRNSTFINCVFHFLSNYGASSEQGRIVVEDCWFDGPTTAFTGSHVYCSGSDTEWVIRGCTFSNSGQPDPNGAQQGIYLSSCKSFVMSDCTFTNCSKPFDVRSGAKGVVISNILVMGGPNGAGTNGTCEVMCYYAEGAVIQNVSIVNSHKPHVVRLEEGVGNTLRNITYRAGADSPAGQYGFRIGGTGHRIIDPDFVLPSGTSTSAVFRMDDKPTDVEIVGGSVQGASQMFLLDGTQTTVAARVRGVGSTGLTDVWVKSAGGGTGSTPTAQLLFQGSTEWRSYTPTLGNFTGTVNYARFSLSGDTVKVQVSITVSAVSGSVMTLTLPTGPRLTGHPASGAFIAGQCVVTDVSAGAATAGAVVVIAPTARMLFGSSWAGTTVPFTWAAGDTISLEMEYERG